MNAKKCYIFLAIIVALVFLPVSGMAFTIAPFYAGSYTAVNLGSVPGVLTNYGGLTLKAGDPNTLLIGGSANNANGKVYSIGVTRDVGNHITGFTDTATVFADGAYNDGGLEYGPGGVLFFTRYPVNQIGEIKPGSAIIDKIVDLSPLGVASSVGGLAFVPAGFPGAGQLKLVSWSGGQWYTAAFSPDGSGTYDITSATFNTTIVGGPEGIAYVPIGSPLFGLPSVLISEYSAGKVATYEVDANGNPIGATRRDFIIDLTGAEGALIDPLTGDFLFSTFGGGNQVVVVQGFVPPPIPIPPALLLFGSGLAALAALSRRRKP